MVGESRFCGRWLLVAEIPHEHCCCFRCSRIVERMCKAATFANCRFTDLWASNGPRQNFRSGKFELVGQRVYVPSRFHSKSERQATCNGLTNEERGTDMPSMTTRVRSRCHGFMPALACWPVCGLLSSKALLDNYSIATCSFECGNLHIDVHLNKPHQCIHQC